MVTLLAFAYLSIVAVLQVEAATKRQLEFFGSSVVHARIDSIVSPGDDVVSDHVHSALGANNWASNSTFDSLRQATCTSIPIPGLNDLSMYWAPAMYHYNANNQTYTLVDSIGKTVYYNLDHGPNEKITAFPNDFKMIAGNMQCAPNGNLYYGTGLGNTADIPRSISPTGRLTMHLTFPSCWSGKPFNLSTQNQNLVYPSGAFPGICPKGYTTRLPRLMYSWFVSIAGLPVNQPNTTVPTLLCQWAMRGVAKVMAIFKMAGEKASCNKSSTNVEN